MIMDSPQSVISPMKNSVNSEFKKMKEAKEVADMYSGNIHGVLEVCIHQARDIHNICIYHKQDVYAKLSLTSDPENTVSSKIINGGGRNPVFNENLRLDVVTMESSLKCEIWMLSRVRNYLEDQLLGFALVPLSEIIINNGKLEREFSLSSTDLFHSPAGFVQLSFSFAGIMPEVMEIPKSSSPAVEDSEISASLPCDLVKIEFPDPNIAKEDQIMVSEYFGISSSENTDSFVGFDGESNLTSEEIGVRVVECISKSTANYTQSPEEDSPPSSDSTNGSSSSPALPGSLNSLKTPSPEHISASEESKPDSDGVPANNFTAPVITVKIEPEQTVVQQEIVDMYMKSMQQFTESLAKMKLPLDIDNGPTSSGSSSSDQKNNGSRVFYGSRAFF